MEQYEFHPLSSYFPLMEGEEFKELVEDIKENGLRNRIILYDGKILDGRNRYNACLEAETKMQFTDYEGDDPLKYVISQNLKRRHLTASQRAAWANENDATRDGAYACVLAAVELTKCMVAIRRAEIKTGADYYVGKPGEALEDLEKCYRLEISGVDKGTFSTVQQRAREKLCQTAAGASNLPAIAGVVGFRAKLVILQRLEE